MAEFAIDTTALKRLDRSFTKAGKDFKKGRKKFLKKLGVVVQGLAKEYCPESPNIGDYARKNKSGVTKRRRDSITTGSLRDSITVEAKSDRVSISVPSNARGGKYAEKIHDKKGSEWHEVGVRTKMKGAKADEKFIFRAGKDSEKEQSAIVDAVLDKFINGIGV